MNERSEDSVSKFEDYYAILGVEPSAEISVIRKAYIRRAKEEHPDTGGSEDIMRVLNRAYKCLINPDAKAAYDMLHSYHTGATKPSDYKYTDGRQINDVTDMSDEEIDSFLDNLLFDEYRDGVSKPKSSPGKWFKNKFK